MKQCSRCKEWKNESEFNKYKNAKDRLNAWCRICNKEYHQEHYKRNKNKINEHSKKWNRNNKEKRREYNKEYGKKYSSSLLPFNSTAKYRQEIGLYEDIKESNNGNLMCKCAYCGGWFEPTVLQIRNRINAVNGGGSKGEESRLYCSEQCKQNCPIYNQSLHAKDKKPATSREVQPELRQMVFARDNYTCQKCNTHKDNLKVGLHCHHIEGIQWEPLQSADMDMCITFCEDCHKEVHQIDGCGYYDMQCK